MTTYQPITDATVTAEALRGPWQALLLDGYGYVLPVEEFLTDGTDPDDVRVVIVRGTASPVSDCDGDSCDDDTCLRMPGEYLADDLLIEFDGGSLCEAEAENIRAVLTWVVQAMAMAAGLNAAAQAVTR